MSVRQEPGVAAASIVRRRPPRVSIGLPVFNGERYLEATLAAVLGQDFADFELLISDNASTDRTRDISEEFAARDRRVSYHRNSENIGAARNYNQVARMALAEFFRWQTYDDLVEPTHLGRCMRVFDEGASDVVLVYPQTLLIDGRGQVIEPYDDRTEVTDPRPDRRLAHLLRHLHLCNAVLGVARMEALRKTRLIGPYRGSDVVLLAELAMLGTIIEIPERLFMRRRSHELPSPANLSPDAQARWYDTRRKGDRLPLTTLFWQHLVSSARLPIPLADRARCGWTVFREWGPRHWRSIGGELKLELKSLLRA